MTVKADPEFTGVFVPTQGEYIGTYESDHAQASAQLFKKGIYLRAILSYPKDLESQKIVDHYMEDLRQIAQERGLQLKILHAA